MNDVSNTANQGQPTHLAVQMDVYQAVLQLLNGMPRGQVNAIVTAYEQSKPMTITEAQ